MDDIDMQDDGQERGDETPYWPPLGSPEWERRLRQASLDLRRAEREIYEHCSKINLAVTKLFRELESQ